MPSTPLSLFPFVSGAPHSSYPGPAGARPPLADSPLRHLVLEPCSGSSGLVRSSPGPGTHTASIPPEERPAQPCHPGARRLPSASPLCIHPQRPSPRPCPATRRTAACTSLERISTATDTQRRSLFFASRLPPSVLVLRSTAVSHCSCHSRAVAPSVPLPSRPRSPPALRCCPSWRPLLSSAAACSASD